MVADGLGAKGGESAGGGGSSERESPKPGAAKVPPIFEDGVAVGMKDCGRCLVEDNFAALVGERSQTDEGTGKRWHDMA